MAAPPVVFRPLTVNAYNVLDLEGKALGWVVLRRPRYWDAYVFGDPGSPGEKVDHGCLSRAEAARSILRRLDAPGWDA